MPIEIRDASQPILWCDKVVRERVRRVEGQRVLERFPQSQPDPRMPGVKRYVMMVDSAGNVLPCPLTGAAADLDLDGEHPRRMRAKFRRLGWFPTAACPVALVAVGELALSHIDGSHDSTPCQRGTYSEDRPCRHAMVEIEFRRSAHAAEERSRLPKLKDLGEQLADAQKAQVQSNQDLIQGMAGAIKEAVAGAVAAVREPYIEPPPAPEKGKK